MKFCRSVMSPIALGFAFCLLPMGTRAQTIQVSKDNRTIAVTSTESASVMADTATVNVGYVAYGSDAKAAYANGSRISNAIAQAFSQAAVAKDAIESQAESVSETPQFELEKLSAAEREQRKYKVSQSWTVKTRADDAAKILNVAVNAGANQSGNIGWGVADEGPLEAQAAAKALTHAHAVAEQMARGLGIKLGNLIYASNQSPEVRPMGPMMLRSAEGAMGAMEKAPPPIEPLSIHPHKVYRSATVYAVFAIE